VGNSAYHQITSTIKGSFFSRYGQFTHDSNPNVSINNDAVATVENTNPSFDLWNCASKNTNKLACHSRLYGLGIDTERPKILVGRININYWQIVK
jgi:hypothetical protein